MSILLRVRLLAVACLLSLTSLACGAGGPAFTDAASAGPDYQVQGEYAASDKIEGDYAAQVVALGDAKFDIVLYAGGLPGAGWKRGDTRFKGTGETKDESTAFKFNDSKVGAASLKGGTLAVSVDGKSVSLKKVERKSPTLGAKPPSGANVLFDGSSADNFTNGKLVESNLLGATNCESKQKFQDHSFHIEFRTPFMPKARGQGRGNSGVYIQGRYECQVLDSFGLEGENNECGGIYQQAKPAVNMCLPPLAWQTYDIDFTAAKYDADGKKTENARVTVKHNGVTVYDNLELKKDTPGHHTESAGPDGLFLQNHGDPVAFRNIWVVEKK